MSYEGSLHARINHATNSARHAATAALKQLADVGAKVSGVVLNQVDIKRHASCAYGDAAQYYVEYSRCYTK